MFKNYNEASETADEAYKDYLIDKEGEYKCSKCKKTDVDINRKIMMNYYRCCGVCRPYLYNREVVADCPTLRAKLVLRDCPTSRT
jgi:hypothetical protein